MRRLISILLFLVIFASQIMAQEVLTVLPAETGVLTMYDFECHSLKLGVRYPVINWESILFLDGAVVTDSKFNDTAFGVGIGTELIALAKKMGLATSVPVNVNLGFLYTCSFHEGSVPKPCYGPWLGFTLKL